MSGGLVKRRLETLNNMMAFKKAKVQRGKEVGKTLHYEAAEAGAIEWILKERERMMRDLNEEEDEDADTVGNR